MKTCSNCKAQLDDSAKFCNICGMAFIDQQPAENGQPEQSQSRPEQPRQPYTQPPVYAQPPVYQPMPDPYDHTAEFDPADISENKVICLCPYVLGVVGVIVALLVGGTSAYTAFHVRQALKITVVQTVAAVLGAVFCFLVLPAIALAVLTCILIIARIICFVQICKGQAKEPILIRKLNFLK